MNNNSSNKAVFCVLSGLEACVRRGCLVDKVKPEIKINFIIMSKKPLTFSTFDLGLANTLTTLKYELIKLDKTDPKKVRFIFKETKDIEQTMLKYWNNEITVPALTFFNNLKTLKNRIYSDSE